MRNRNSISLCMTGWFKCYSTTSQTLLSPWCRTVVTLPTKTNSYWIVGRWLSPDNVFLYHYLTTRWTPLQENEVRAPFSLPILAFLPKLASDGLPMLSDWLATAASIWAVKYEAWREPFEIKAVEGKATPGQPLSFASLEVVKGCGRVSILLFSLFYTYLEFKNTLEQEELDSLKEPHDRKGTEKGTIHFWDTWGYAWVVFDRSVISKFQRWWWHRHRRLRHHGANVMDVEHFNCHSSQRWWWHCHHRLATLHWFFKFMQWFGSI